MKVNICYPGEDLWSFDLDVQNVQDLFPMFNHGSGRECEEFLEEKMRSLSVGDFVQFDGQWWWCKSFDWEMVKPNFVIGECCIRPKKSLRWDV